MTNMGSEKILVVDDEKNIIDAMKDIFAKTDYNVEYANTGKETLEKLNSDTYNIVVVDTTLPDADALELLDKIKNIDPLIRVIMMAWHTSAANITEAFRKKASEFILKPFQSNDVLKKIRKSLLFQRMSRTRERSKNLISLE